MLAASWAWAWMTHKAAASAPPSGRITCWEKTATSSFRSPIPFSSPECGLTNIGNVLLVLAPAPGL